jgi:hypothetical protein
VRRHTLTARRLEGPRPADPEGVGMLFGFVGYLAALVVIVLFVRVAVGRQWLGKEEDDG